MPAAPGPPRLFALAGARRWRAALAAVLAVGAFVAAAWWTEAPPAPAPAAAPATEFSAERAWAHLERIAGPEPTPIGSAAGDAVRDYLVDELSRLGLAAEVQHGAGAKAFGADVVAGRVENVVATLPGTSSTGELLLGAHYDSTFSGPGATDDKASVAAILEAARALVAGPRPRNDIVLLLTDGEEPGMLGASAYAEQDRGGRPPGVLLNWEGPGNAGSSALFQTSPGAAGVLAAFAADARYPIGNSLAPSVIGLLSNHTDLNVLGDVGFEGLTFGFTDGRAYYHSSQDTVENFDRASLQQHGANLLALARGFGERELPTLFTDSEATFITVFGLVVVYPNELVAPLAAAALAAVVALGLLARRRGLVSLPRLLAGAAAGLVPLAAAVLGGIALWELLLWARPGYGALMVGEPYRPVLYRWALGLLAATVVLAWFLLLRRRIGDAGLVICALLWPAGIGAVLAWFAPGISFFASIAALLAAVGGLVAVSVAERRPVLRLAAWTLGIAPGVLLVLDTGRTTLQVGGIALGAGGAFCFALAALVALPLAVVALPMAGRSRSVLVPGLAALLTVALVGAGFLVDRFDEEHPQPTHLMYVLDADTATARWASSNEAPHEWVQRYVPDPVSADAPALPLPYGARPRWAGPADVAPLAAPDLTVLGTRRDGADTVVELQLRSARAADVLALHVDRPVGEVAVHTEGLPVVTATPTYASRGEPWPFLLQFYDAPPAGITVQLRVADAAGLGLVVSDYTAQLAGLPGFSPRPPGLTRGNEHTSDLTVVRRTHRLPT